MRRGALALAAAAALVFTVAASAGDVTRRDSAGDVRAPRLTPAERDALDVVSVRAIGSEAVGVVVTVTFRGDVTQRLGRGGLKDGLVALVLWPKNAALAPSALATRGTSPRNVLRKTRSEVVGALRSGRTIRFYVGGGGYSKVGRIEIRTFADLPLRSSRALAAGPPKLSDEDFKRIAKLDNLDGLVAAADAGKLTCKQLETLNSSVLFMLGALVKEDLRKGADPDADRDVVRLRGFQAAIKTRLDDQCRDLPKTPEATLAWSFFGTSTVEVVGKGFFAELSGRKVLSLRVRVPNHDIDAALCPPQLPRLTFLARDTIQCEGGELREGVEFTVNVRTTPKPERAMGGELTATLDDGSQIGPFTITGP